MEKSFVFKVINYIIDIKLPGVAQELIHLLEEMQQNQNPPFSDGIYFTELFNEWKRKYDGPFFEISRLYPLFSLYMVKMACHENILYSSSDLNKFSVRKITAVSKKGTKEEYKFFLDEIKLKFPKYRLNEDHLLESVDDIKLNLDE